MLYKKQTAPQITVIILTNSKPYPTAVTSVEKLLNEPKILGVKR